MSSDPKVDAELEQQKANWAERIKNSKFFNSNSGEKSKTWGYDLYPERKKKFEADLLKVAMMKEGREYYDKSNCEKNVFECVKRSPLVKIMVESLKSAGW